MAGIQIGVGMDVSGVVQGTEQIKNAFSSLNSAVKQPVVGAATLPPMQVQNQSGAPIPSNNSSSTEEFLYGSKNKDLMAIFVGLTDAIKQNTLAMTNKQAADRQYGSSFSPSEQSLLRNGFQLINLAAGVYSGYEKFQTSNIRRRTKELQADPYGAEIESVSGSASLQNTVVDTIGNALGIGLSFIPGLGPLIGMGIGQAVKGIGNAVVGAYSEREIAEIQQRQYQANKYQNRLGLMDESFMKFGYGSNMTMGNIQASMLNSSMGTGMLIDEFMRSANGLAQYGVSDIDSVGSLARGAALASRYTGADNGSLINYLGTQSRYGGNAIGNMNYAYSAALSSGLTRNQFGEFLDGLQSVIESGISKGYVKSTKEVSDTMVMFDKLSGGSKFWQGEQGFQRFNSISNGISNATNLGSSTQLAVYQALAGLGDGDILDTFSMMEKGLSVSAFNAIANRFSNIYGGDKFSEVSAWKELSGLNYTGAMQLYDMAHSGRSVTDSDIKKLQANPEYQNDQTRVRDSLNVIETQVTEFGSRYFPEYLRMLSDITRNNASDLKNNHDRFSDASNIMRSIIMNGTVVNDDDIVNFAVASSNSAYSGMFSSVMRQAGTQLQYEAQDKYNYMKKYDPNNPDMRSYELAANRENSENTERMAIYLKQILDYVAGNPVVVYNQPGR